MRVSLKTMDDCYQEDDPQNPYGELGDYPKLLEKAWKEFHDQGLDYFIAYEGAKPINFIKG